MFTYLVFKPGLELTAEIEAPDTKHARTLFLDYLARNNYIQWKDRTAVRTSLKAVQVNPGESNADITLSYSGTAAEAPIEQLNVPDVAVQDMPEQLAGPPVEPESVPQPQSPINPTTPAGDTSRVFGNSPIMNLSKKTGGR